MRNEPPDRFRLLGAGRGADQIDERAHQPVGAEPALRPAALVGQFARHLVPAIADLAHHHRVGHEDAIERDLVEIMLVGEVHDRPHGDPRRGEIDQELADAGVAVLAARAGAHEQDHHVAAMRVAGPDLGALDLPAAFHLARARPDRGQVRARIGLAHADAEIAFAARDPRQVGALLLFSAEAQDGRTGLAVSDPMRARRCARRQHLLGEDIALERRAALAAIVLGPGHADPAVRADGAAEVGRESAPSLEARREAAAGALLGEKAAQLDPERLGLGRQLDRAEAERRRHCRSLTSPFPTGERGFYDARGRFDMRWKPLLGAALAAALAHAAPASALVKITTGLIGSPNSGGWPYYIGIDKGYFAAAGIEPDLIYVPTAPGLVQQLVGGSLDMVGNIGVVEPIHAVAKGAQIAILRTTSGVTPYEMLAKPEIKSVKDLKGKTICIGGLMDINRVYLERIMQANGLKDGDYDIVVIGNTAQRFAALKSGTVDATMLVPPANFYAEKAGFTNIGMIMDYAKDLPMGSADVSIAWAKAHPDAAKSLVAVLDKSIAWFYDDRNRDEAIDILVKASHAESRRGRRELRLHSPDRHVRQKPRRVAQPASAPDRRDEVDRRLEGHAGDARSARHRRPDADRSLNAAISSSTGRM